jgi:hypothetical protein
MDSLIVRASWPALLTSGNRDAFASLKEGFGYGFDEQAEFASASRQMG